MFIKSEDSETKGGFKIEATGEKSQRKGDLGDRFRGLVGVKLCLSTWL